MTTLLKTTLAALTLLGAAVPAQAFQYNDSGTIQRALSGNSVIGALSDGLAYCEYHAPNSGIFGRDYEVYAGNWRVANNYICYAYPGSPEDCQRALMHGQRITFLDANTGTTISTGTIVPGNMCS